MHFNPYGGAAAEIAAGLANAGPGTRPEDLHGLLRPEVFRVSAPITPEEVAELLRWGRGCGRCSGSPTWGGRWTW
ncbi:hypothetical protein [Thermocatellispora tengchongensis]|uniref:hypothetical protein n=1 Tax=Thermocatellispora tengchongensis TaxID=1073253 RepID=UPI00362D0CFB